MQTFVLTLYVLFQQHFLCESWCFRKWWVICIISIVNIIVSTHCLVCACEAVVPIHFAITVCALLDNVAIHNISMLDIEHNRHFIYKIPLFVKRKLTFTHLFICKYIHTINVYLKWDWIKFCVFMGRNMEILLKYCLTNHQLYA